MKSSKHGKKHHQISTVVDDDVRTGGIKESHDQIFPGEDSSFEAEDRALLASIENESWKSVENIESEKQRFNDLFRHEREKRKLISLRIPMDTLDVFRENAKNEGIPYQTLIISLIHKYNRDSVLQK